MTIQIYQQIGEIFSSKCTFNALYTKINNTNNKQLQIINQAHFDIIYKVDS